MRMHLAYRSSYGQIFRLTSDREGDISILIGHYLIAEGIDVRQTVERHELRLVDRDQWQDFFRNAGLSAEYLPDAFSSRGFYMAQNLRIGS